MSTKHCLLALALALATGLTATPSPSSSTSSARDEIRVVVVDERGEPVAAARVELRVGRILLDVNPGLPYWAHLLERESTTDNEGMAAFSGLPPGSVGVAHVRAGQLLGVEAGAGEIRLQARPTMVGKGKVRAKRQLLSRGLTVKAYGPYGTLLGEAPVDGRGAYEFHGLPTGEVELRLMEDTWPLARKTVEIEAGNRARLPALEATDGAYVPRQGPMVDVRSVVLVDDERKPVPDVRLEWTSRYMWGAMPSDENGEVKLIGGGVSIGGPPYRLLLSDLEGEDGHYWGWLKKVSRGQAVVQVERTYPVTGRVLSKQGKLSSFLVWGIVEAPDGPLAQLTNAAWERRRVTDGSFALFLPAGEHRIAIGAPDGTLRIFPCQVSTEEEPQELTLELEAVAAA